MASSGLTLLAAPVGAVPLPCAPAGHEAPELRFRHLGHEEGLVQSSVMTLLRDRRGFLWAGTQGGLHRYDGYRFTVRRPDPYDPRSLAHGHVQALLEDADGALWVGTFRGLDRLDPVAGGFARVPLAGEGERPPHVLSLAADGRGGLWIGTLGQGLWHRDAGGRVARFRHRADDPRSLPGDTVWSLAVDGDGALWVATAPGGLARLPATATDETAASLARAAGVAGEAAAYALHRDAAGRLWAGTERGLLRLGDGGGEWTVAVAGLDVRAVAGDPAGDEGDEGDEGNGVLWLATADAGLVRLDVASGRTTSYRHRAGDPASLADDALRSLLVDRSGLLWVGTVFAGLDVAEPRPALRHVRPRPDPGGLPHGVVRAFARRGDDLWVGTDGGGLALCAAGADGFRALRHDPADPRTLVDDRVWTLYTGGDGALWVGTDEALHRLRAAGDGFDRWRHDPGDPRSLAPGSVRALADAGDGRLWVGHFGGGLDLFDPAAGVVERHRHRPGDPRALSSDLVLVLAPGRAGTWWVGTADGLDLLRPGTGVVARFRHRRGDPSTLAGDIVRALHRDGGGDLWVGTDAGLTRLAGDPLAGPVTLTHLREADGLPDATVYAILEDGAGDLWLSTNRGLARYRPASGEVATYDLADGVQALEFNGAAALRDGDVLYFGGVDGFNVFRPAELATARPAPPVAFTAVEVPGREPAAVTGTAVGGGEVVLAHDERTLALEFAALDFSDPGGHRYAYRLRGLSDEWIDLGPAHDLVLTGLEPGDYRLEVRSADDAGAWGRTAAAIDLRVLPAPWRTPWAYLLYALAILAVAAVVAWQTHRRRAVERRMHAEIRTREERLELALIGSGDGLWDWDLRTGELYRAHFAEMLGYRPDELPAGLDLHERLTHPDDRGRALAAAREHLEGRTPRYECEYRLRTKSGEWRWIHDRGLVVERDTGGRPLRIAGTFKDISRPKQVEAELRLWATVFDNALEGVVIVDAGGTIQAVNGAFCRLAGRDEATLVGSPVDVLRSAEHPRSFYRDVRRALAADGTWRGEVRHRRPDGSQVVAWVSLTRVRDADGRTSHDVGVVSDITRRKESEEELRYLASFDVLTGLANRASFRDQLERAIAVADRHARPLALLFADLDGLKAVNDAHGHPVGDALLGEAARRFEASVRRGDVVARQSGDEFTVLVGEIAADPAAGRAQVAAVAKRIVAAFDRPFHLAGHDVVATVSLGVALYPADGDDADDLLRHADAAMYRAKDAGRDRYCFYGDVAREAAAEREP